MNHVTFGDAAYTLISFETLAKEMEDLCDEPIDPVALRAKYGQDVYVDLEG